MSRQGNAGELTPVANRWYESDMSLIETIDASRLSPELLLASFYVCPSHDQYRTRIPGLNVFLVLDGRMDFQCADGARGRAGAGDVVTFYHGVNICRVGSQPLSIYQVIFYPAPAPSQRAVPSVEGLGPLPHLLHVGERTAPFVASFERMMDALLRLPAMWRLEAAAGVFDLLTLMFETVSADKPRPVPHLTEWDRMLVAIEQDDQRLCVSEMAHRLGLSVRHFSREFRRRFGKSPRQYGMDRRLWRAHQSIAEGASAKAAAYETGFSDPSHFNRLFKRRFGYCPGETRSRLALRPADDPLRNLSLPACRHLVAPGLPTGLFAP